MNDVLSLDSQMTSVVLPCFAAFCRAPVFFLRQCARAISTSSNSWTWPQRAMKALVARLPAEALARGTVFTTTNKE